MSMRKNASILALSAVVLPLLASSACSCGKRQTNGVFVMTNTSKNAVAAFHVNESEKLISSGRAEYTQGTGFGSSSNPLNSQGALAVSGDGNWLIAPNAGSNDISIFSTNNNRLTFVSKTSSQGQFPVSVATNDNRVFVLNKKGMVPNIAGFFIEKNGELKAIDQEKAVRPLTSGSDYSQIGISPNGKWLIVSNESANMLIAYALNGDTIAKDFMTLGTSGSGPAAFAFDNHNNLLVAESNSSTVSSYSLSDNGITVITASLSIGQQRPRWIVCNGKYAYTSAMNSGFFSAIAVGENGQLTLIKTYDAGSTGVTELAINYDGTYLYTFNPKTNALSQFHIGTDGSLTLTDSINDYFGPYAQGIVAN
ncbi:MAG: lactonase family protein [Dehalococcoidia bacterium]|nr:lactonase family protein [Dehalococcoidia bacterium]